jgi:MerR family transcriptional regulator, mercuric resistance operon regulatory protein
VPPVTASRADRSDGIPIGELSRLTGVNIETIRCYEKIKMAHHPPYRRWPSSVWTNRNPCARFHPTWPGAWFRPRRHPRSARLGAPGNASCGDVREIASHHLDDIRSKITDLRKLERLLSKTIAQCSGSNAPDCPVVDVLDVRRS